MDIHKNECVFIETENRFAAPPALHQDGNICSRNCTFMSFVFCFFSLPLIDIVFKLFRSRPHRPCQSSVLIRRAPRTTIYRRRQLWPPRLRRPSLLRRRTVAAPLVSDVASIVFTLAGFANPRRKELRELGTDKGAQYRPHWAADCTHVVAACKIGTKTSEAKAAGVPIVSETWFRNICSRNCTFMAFVFFFFSLPLIDIVFQLVRSRPHRACQSSVLQLQSKFRHSRTRSRHASCATSMAKRCPT